MADFSIGDRILENQLYEQEQCIPVESDSVTHTKHRVLREAYELFCAHFGPLPISDLRAAIAPGRVNLIGEHIDYCDGIVLPMAIPLYTVVIGRKCLDGEEISNFHSTHFNETVQLRKPWSCNDRKYPPWSNYIRGILALSGCQTAFDALVHSDVPPGSGLSSSAALELSTLLFVRQFSDSVNVLSPIDCALLSRQAEHEYAHVPCGIMDQFVISLARFSHALKIDCRSLDYDPIPMAFGDDAVFLVVNSGVKHALAGGEYAKRKASVDQAMQLLGVPSWRDVSHDMIRSKSGSFNDASMLDNSLHVVHEIERTVRAVEALLDNNIMLFGKLMTESHISLRDKYHVSCAELDELVALSLAFKGVFGSRMTGGGFGGCTVTLVRKDRVKKLEEHLREHYKGGQPTFFICEPVGGAEVASLEFLN